MQVTKRVAQNEKIQVLTMEGVKGDKYSMDVVGDGSGHYESQDHISIFLKGEQNLWWDSPVISKQVLNTVAPTWGGSVIYDPDNKWSYPEGTVHYEVVEDCMNVFVYPSKARRDSVEEVKFDYEVVEAEMPATCQVDGWIIPLEGEHELTIHAIPAGKEIKPVVRSMIVWEE